MSVATPYAAAAIQFEPRQFDKEDNVVRLLGLVKAAARDGARLIVTPEMGTTGYCWFSREEVAPFVEPVPGPTTDRFHALARAHDVYVVVGMPEIDPATGLYYNVAVLIGPDGVLGTHRKTHPYIAEPKWSAPGNRGHQVFETPLGRIALLVCMDLHFLETSRLVALQGAEIICHISNWLAERTPAPYWISRAFENGCYLIESNRWGLERTVQFSGGSCIIAPDGSIEAAIDCGDGAAIAAIDLGRVAAARSDAASGLELRRPELYPMLVSNPFTWTPSLYFSLYGHRPLPPGRRSRVAAAQMRPAAPDDVRPHIARMTGDAAAAGAELVVFPELILAGPDQAETVPGPASRFLIELAARHRCHIVAGLAEQAGAFCYNSAILVGPGGVIACYRKLHLGPGDRPWATAGKTWTFADTVIGRVGLLVGNDALVPEAGRILALEGCDLIACPAALRGRFTLAHAGTSIGQNYPIPTGADPHHWHHFRCRAGENNVLFAFANQIDEARGIAGKSGVFGADTFVFPRNEAIVFEGEGLALAELDTRNFDTEYPTTVIRRKDLLTMRLPQHYEPLVVGGTRRNIVAEN